MFHVWQNFNDFFHPFVNNFHQGWFGGWRR